MARFDNEHRNIPHLFTSQASNADAQRAQDT